MRVTVRLFAGLREQAGWGERELDGVAHVADVWPALGLGDEPAGLAIAVNREYAERDRPLADGDEVAFIPPVSGGAFRLSEEPLDLAAVVAEVQSDDAGAIAVFAGTTRAYSRDRKVRHLEYEAYREMAEEAMADIAAGLQARYELHGIAIHHRLGRVEVGGTSVVIAVSAPHRADALAACKDAIDTLKQTVPLWKKETYDGGEEWIGKRLVTGYGESMEPLPTPDPERDYEPIHPGGGFRDLLKKIFAPILFLGGVAVKFGFVFFKFFALFVAIGGYALIWGWRFAVGFVALIFIHEMGHYVVARRLGLNPKMPIFIPFFGAFVTHKLADPWRQARVSLAGPVVGGLASAVFFGAGQALDSDLLRALGYTGFFLNLFNMLPAWILDGAQVLRCTRWLYKGGMPTKAYIIGSAAVTTVLLLVLGMVAAHVPQSRL